MDTYKATRNFEAARQQSLAARDREEAALVTLFTALVVAACFSANSPGTSFESHVRGKNLAELLPNEDVRALINCARDCNGLSSFAEALTVGLRNAKYLTNRRRVVVDNSDSRFSGMFRFS